MFKWLKRLLGLSEQPKPVEQPKLTEQPVLKVLKEVKTEVPLVILNFKIVTEDGDLLVVDETKVCSNYQYFDLGPGNIPYPTDSYGPNYKLLEKQYEEYKKTYVVLKEVQFIESLTTVKDRNFYVQVLCNNTIPPEFVRYIQSDGNEISIKRSTVKRVELLDEQEVDKIMLTGYEIEENK